MASLFIPLHTSHTGSNKNCERKIYRILMLFPTSLVYIGHPYMRDFHVLPEMGKDRKILASSRVTRRFQITLSKFVRERFPVEEGDLILFVWEDGRLILEKG